MNRHSLVAVMSCWLSWSAAASDFSCLQAIIPATDHYWIRTHRTQFSLPQVSASGGAIAIAQWDHDHLINVFVYTEKSSRRFDRVTTLGSTQPQSLNSLANDWLKTHLLATKLDGFEVFEFPVAPPNGWDRKPIPIRQTASVETGGWLVESEEQKDAKSALDQEIEFRQNWVKNNNLDANRFKAWTKAEKICHH